MIEHKDIFLGLCEYYRALGLRKYHFGGLEGKSKALHTNRIISYFDLLGRVTGFEPLVGMRLESIVEPVHPLVKGGEIDLLWKRQDYPDSYPLAMESQLRKGEEVLRSCIMKLEYIDATLKVLYCRRDSAGDDSGLKSLYNRVVGELALEENTEQPILFVVIPWGVGFSSTRDRVQGVLMKPGGDVLGRGSGEIMVEPNPKGEEYGLVGVSDSTWTDTLLG